MAARKLTHARQRLNALLLRHGLRYPKDTKWTQEHTAWLRRQRFDSPVLQFTYESDIEQVELLAAHLKRVDQHVAEVAQDCQYTPVVNALMCLRGIQVTTGFGRWKATTGFTASGKSSMLARKGLSRATPLMLDCRH